MMMIRNNTKTNNKNPSLFRDVAFALKTTSDATFKATVNHDRMFEKMFRLKHVCQLTNCKVGLTLSLNLTKSSQLLQ